MEGKASKELGSKAERNSASVYKPLLQGSDFSGCATSKQLYSLQHKSVSVKFFLYNEKGMSLLTIAGKSFAQQQKEGQHELVLLHVTFSVARYDTAFMLPSLYRTCTFPVSCLCGECVRCLKEMYNIWLLLGSDVIQFGPVKWEMIAKGCFQSTDSAEEHQCDQTLPKACSLLLVWKPGS